MTGDYQPHRLDVAGLAPRPMLEELSVVIPTLGRPILEECLHWLVAADHWPGALVVVDQGRNPRVAAWLAAIGELGIAAEYLPSEQKGRAAGVNRGLERAPTRFIAVTDDDCFVAADWLSHIQRHFRRHADSVVTGRVEAAGEGVVVVVTSTEPAVQTRPRLTFDSLSGGNMATSRTILDRVGLLDEHPALRTAEDGEWAYRALRAGVPIYYDPAIRVRHFGWRDEGHRQAQYLSYAYSHGGFYGKYLRQGDWFIALRAVAHLLRAGRRWLRATIAGDPEQAAIGLAYFRGLLPGIVSGFRANQR